jgi:hypothetical protein
MGLAVAAAVAGAPVATAVASPPEATDADLESLRSEDARSPTYFSLVTVNATALGLRTEDEQIERYRSFLGFLIGIREYTIRSGGGDVDITGLTATGATRVRFSVDGVTGAIAFSAGGTRVVGGSVRQFITNFENRPLVKFAAAVTFTDVLGRISTGGEAVVPAFIVCCFETDASADGFLFNCTCALQENCYQDLATDAAGCTPGCSSAAGAQGFPCPGVCNANPSTVPGTTTQCP